MEHMQDLKKALLALKPTGEDGFEGLVRTAFSELTGATFRLAGSGSQFGIDGKSVDPYNEVGFECKLYKDDIGRDTVLSKLVDVSLHGSPIDVWVLCSTALVKTQIRDDLRKQAEKDGLPTLVLDWDNGPMPPLAVLLASGGKPCEDFFKSKLNNNDIAKKALAALAAVRQQPDFNSQAERLKADFTGPSLALIMARDANGKWLERAFSDKQTARDRFGQTICPNAEKILVRKELCAHLQAHMAASEKGEVVFVLGGEGNGKSWLVAQAWLTAEDKPLFLLLTPDLFADRVPGNCFGDVLIKELIRQTGADFSQRDESRWRRMLARWKQHNNDLVRPNLVLTIDGINQRPEFDWARIIEHFSRKLGEIGGRLIVTSRSYYYDTFVKGRLQSGEIPRIQLEVPPLSHSELEEILRSCGIEASKVKPTVLSSLQNPRLLGIARELLDGHDIENLDELNDSRLLFEHIRHSEKESPTPQPAYKFAGKLQRLAKEVLQRIKKNQSDDLKIFQDHNGHVAEGRFFYPVEGDHTKYELHDDGLALALAFAILKQLRNARRNGHPLDEALAKIFEPVSALDMSAKVLVAAILVSCLDEEQPIEIPTALITAFAGLQNPDTNDYLSFVSLARKRPKAFLASARELLLAGKNAPNLDWIRGALLEAGHDQKNWDLMREDIKAWFTLHTLEPEFISTDPQKDIEKKKQEREKIKGKLKALAPPEQKLRNELKEINGNISQLIRFAHQLLAGKPLAPFAHSFLLWSFSSTLNCDIQCPYRETIQLTRYNNADWPKMRAAFLKEVSTLSGQEISTVGRWTVVQMLRCTGQADDAALAERFVKDLVKNPPQIPQKEWRLIESYCTTDPCDPKSQEPKNIRNTTEKYANIDVSQLYLSRNQTPLGLFLSMARTGMARFQPGTAIAKQKELIADVLGRVGMPKRLGLSELCPHASLISRENALNIISGLQDAADKSADEIRQDRTAWAITQSSFELAFPLLDGKEQLDALLQKNIGNIDVDILRLAIPVDEAYFEKLFFKASYKKNERALYILLGFALYSGTPLSAKTKQVLGSLLTVPENRIRIPALHLMVLSKDPELIQKIISSKWTADDSKNSFERYLGSSALLDGVKQGLISFTGILNRIDPIPGCSKYLDNKYLFQVALRVEMAIQHILGLQLDAPATNITLRMDTKPFDYTIAELPGGTKDPYRELRQFGMSLEEREKDLERLQESFDAFSDNLSQEKAHAILDGYSLDGFAKLLESAQGMADKLYDLFMKQPPEKLSWVCNFAFFVACFLSGSDPERAVKLYKYTLDVDPIVKYTCGRAQIPLPIMTCWQGQDTKQWNNLRSQSLDRAANDYELSLGVLAALLNGKKNLLKEYVQAKLSSPEPANFSRGLMILGFCDQNSKVNNLLMTPKNEPGFIGQTRKAAKYAYERNVWSRHWFGLMCRAKTPEEFWPASVLFLKIVDGRFVLWRNEFKDIGPIMQKFGLSLDDSLNRRLNNWKDKRTKKLFGDDAPPPLFLRPDEA